MGHPVLVSGCPTRCTHLGGTLAGLAPAKHTFRGGKNHLTQSKSRVRHALFVIKAAVSDLYSLCACVLVRESVANAWAGLGAPLHIMQLSSPLWLPRKSLGCAALGMPAGRQQQQADVGSYAPSLLGNLSPLPSTRWSRSSPHCLWTALFVEGYAINAKAAHASQACLVHAHAVLWLQALVKSSCPEAHLVAMDR
eukprot:363337-Chlamydomonas_euryale.AAC.14